MHHAATAIFDIACDESLQLIKDLEALNLLDDDDDIELLHLLMQEAAVRRKEKFVRCRMDFTSFADKLDSESGEQFYSMFRMKRKSFEKLVRFLKPYLPVDESQSKRCTSGEAPIDAHIKIFCLIRYLAGGAPQDIRVIAGISLTSFYTSIKKALKAVLKCPELQIRLPHTHEELEVIRDGFADASMHEVMRGCVGALDGYLALVNTPCQKEVGNVKDYFSGHYHHMGINCQGMCDHHSRFTYFVVVAPGKTHDSVAYMKAPGLREFIESLDTGRFFVVGDAAYIVTNKLLTPFKGSQRENRDRDAFNFFLSQLRIKIEQAFGMMVEKWRILKRPFTRNIGVAANIIMACARLHNFCINERLQYDHVVNGQLDQTDLCHVFTHEGRPHGYVVSDITHASGGDSTVREWILTSRVRAHALTRPPWNIIRNANTFTA